jgi:hypothetical protein
MLRVLEIIGAILLVEMDISVWIRYVMTEIQYPGMDVRCNVRLRIIMYVLILRLLRLYVYILSILAWLFLPVIEYFTRI